MGTVPPPTETQTSGRRYAPPGKNSFIATFLTFLLPAGGQFYNTDYKKGLALLVGYVICFLMAGTMVITPIAVVVAFALWAWAIFDAYNVAKRNKPLW